MRIPISVIFLSFLCLHMPLTAQMEPEKKASNLKLGFGLTGIGYIGDLSETATLFNRFYPGGNLSLQLDKQKPTQFQFNLGFGKFSEQRDGPVAENPPGITVNTFVQTSFFYGDARFKYTLFPTKVIQPYASLGGGLLIFSPKDANGKFLSNAFGTRQEGEEYSTAVFQIPLTGGVEFRISPSIAASVDYTYRLVTTDYLDNIGNLGTRKGNDALQGLQVALYVTLGEKTRNTSKDKDGLFPVGPMEVAGVGVEAEPKSPSNAGNPSEEEVFIYEVFKDSSKSVSPKPSLEKVADITPAKSPPKAQLEEMDEASLDAYALETTDVFYYKIKRGDTFESLYKRFRVKPHILKQVNSFTGDVPPRGKLFRFPDLRPWLEDKTTSDIDVLKVNDNTYQVRKAPQEAAKPVKQAPETSSTTPANTQNVSVSLEERINQAIDQQSFVYYKIKKGDTVSSVSKAYGIPEKFIRQLNFLTDGKVFKGNFLRIPKIK